MLYLPTGPHTMIVFPTSPEGRGMNMDQQTLPAALTLSLPPQDTPLCLHW